MKKRFITGLIAILPISLTLLIIWFLVTRIGNILGVAIKYIPGLSILPTPVISLIGFLAIILLIYLIGVITSGYIGKRILNYTETLFSKFPVVRTVYTSAHKLTDAIFLSKSAFKKTVFVEFPRKGIYTIGFLTNEASWEIVAEQKSRPGGIEPNKLNDTNEPNAINELNAINDNVNVFIPTAPNPTTGFYLIIPKSQIMEANLSIDEALRTIISGGVIVPDKRKITTLLERTCPDAECVGSGNPAYPDCPAPAVASVVAPAGKGEKDGEIGA
ncbi:MAG: DUF502 domain-containing protein [Candidatus Stahlbacteria bacterium]|nr:DUF502 domain-containing protein [Candidatus Stahlbacteria bacterium]